MSECQLVVSLFDKKFIPEEVIKKPNHNASISSTASSSLSSSPSTNNSIDNNLHQQLLFGKQFWPTSKPTSDDDSTLGSSNSTGRPIKNIFNKIRNKVNPNEVLNRKFSYNNSSPASEENYEDYHLLSQLNQHDRTSTSSYLCYDDISDKCNPISPTNPVAICNLDPLLTPDERISEPIRFNIHIYWEDWPNKHQIELPRSISFHRFKHVISQILRCDIPEDSIVLYHTKDCDIMMKSGINDDNNEEINLLLLDYLYENDYIRVITHDAIWSIYLLMLDEISITLFPGSLI